MRPSRSEQRLKWPSPRSITKEKEKIYTQDKPNLWEVSRKVDVTRGHYGQRLLLGSHDERQRQQSMRLMIPAGWLKKGNRNGGGRRHIDKVCYRQGELLCSGSGQGQRNIKRSIDELEPNL